VVKELGWINFREQMLTEERTQILELWQRSGKPPIPLRQGETCLDLEKFLSHRDIRNNDIEAIKAWAQTKEAEVTTEKQPQLITNHVSQGTSYLASYHAPYYLADGTVVPSVTTILSILDKPGLPYWAWDLGRQGLDYREVRDAAARVGTIAHHLIACHLKGEKANVSEFSPDEVIKAEKCYAKYLAWEKEHPLVPVIIETPFVSEEFKFGGTPDLLAELGGEFILLDFKTGNGIYDSYFYQLAGYRQLFTEQGWPIAGARIVRLSPDDSEVEVAIALDLDRDWQIFQHALAVYTLRGGINA